MQMDGYLDGITRVTTEARSLVSVVDSVCVWNVVMLIVVCGPKGQISELRLTKDYDVVVIFLICRCLYMVYSSAILLDFRWILFAS